MIGEALSFVDSQDITFCSYKSVLRLQHKYWNPSYVSLCFSYIFPGQKSHYTFNTICVFKTNFHFKKGDKLQKCRNLNSISPFSNLIYNFKSEIAVSFLYVERQNDYIKLYTFTYTFCHYKSVIYYILFNMYLIIFNLFLPCKLKILQTQTICYSLTSERAFSSINIHL